MNAGSPIAAKAATAASWRVRVSRPDRDQTSPSAYPRVASARNGNSSFIRSSAGCTSNAQYLAEIQRLHEQALREKDARLADKDAIIKALTDVAGDAAAKAETAASTSERAAKTANQAIKELRDPTPASPPPAPVAPPSWHDGP